VINSNDILSYTVLELSQLIVQIFDTLRFESPLGSLGTTYDVHVGLIAKRVVDFLLVLIEFFSLGVTAESLRAKRDRKSAISLQRGQFGRKFQVEGVTPTNHLPIIFARIGRPMNALPPTKWQCECST